MINYFGGLAHVHTRLSNHSRHRESNMSLDWISQTLAKSLVKPGYIAFTEHPSDPGRPHYLDDASSRVLKLLEHTYEAPGLPPVIKGLEVSIMADGTLELSNEVLAGYQMVIASRHRLPRRVEKSRRYIEQHFILLAANPLVDVIGHPNRFLMDRIDIDWPSVFAAAAETQTAIEINVNIFPYARRFRGWWKSRKQQKPWQEWLKLLAASGAPVFIGSDIHTRDQLERWLRDLAQLESPLGAPNRLSRLAAMLESCGIPPERVVTRDYAALSAWLRDRRS